MEKIELKGRKSFGLYQKLAIIFAVCDVALEIAYTYARLLLPAMIIIGLFLYIFKFAFLYCLIKCIIWKCIDDYHEQEIITMQQCITDLEKKNETAQKRLEYFEDKLYQLEKKL